MGKRCFAVYILMAFFTCFLNVVDSVAELSDTTSIDFDDIYQQRLLSLIDSASNQDPLKLNEVNGAFRDFVLFSKEHPKSRFADDAECLGSIILFTGALNNPNGLDSQLKFRRLYSESIKHFPNSTIEDLSISLWKKRLGDQAASILYFPYEDIVIWMDGNIEFNLKNWKSAIDKFLMLKNKGLFLKDATATMAGEVYLPLMISYKQLGLIKDSKAIAKEAMDKFPGTRLYEIMKEYSESV